MQKQTPLMKQYWEIKSAHPDKIVLFRMGDFYEMFFEDAVQAAPVLNIALTSRNKKSQDETPMCGVPHHSIEGPINKLLKAGFKVAICEQLEDPAQAKGIVKRGVTRILTPGMVYDPNTIPSHQMNYICAVGQREVAFVDVSTGEAFYYEGTLAQIQPIIQVLRPVEFLVGTLTEEEKQWLSERGAITWSNDLGEGEARQALRKYVESSQGGLSPEFFEKRSMLQKLSLNSLAIKHLEIFETYSGDERGSLFSAIDRTKTSLGRRQFKKWLSFPETSEVILIERQDEVAAWMGKHPELKNVRSVLSQVGDLERRLARIHLSTCNARDLQSLGQSLELSWNLYKDIEKTNVFEGLGQDVKTLLETLKDELPLSVKEGSLIRPGAYSDLDELVALTDDHAQILSQVELKERETTGISSLKVKYNAVFGYFIEVTHTHKDKVPKHYIRKQTLAQAERFTTDELVQLEEKILSARSKRFQREYEIFEVLKKQLIGHSSEILRLANWVARLDVLTSLAWLATEQSYVRPTFTDGEIEILSSKHPVIEQSQGSFVANDIRMIKGESLLLTGPNMAGKSTVMRQVAITSLMAQIGSFVPARSARVPIFENILTRIGASDNLSEGLSTFMVEMKEAADLIQSAGTNSLVILDEIGRGTSTFDGMSLAQAIFEHLHCDRHATILFATHYHELAKLENELNGVLNYHMAIQDGRQGVRFLYQLTRGPAGKSYGIQVGELAGLPKSVTDRAHQILKSLENIKVQNQMSLFERLPEEAPINQELLDLDLNQLTPLAALMKIAQWREKLL